MLECVQQLGSAEVHADLTAFLSNADGASDASDRQRALDIVECVTHLRETMAACGCHALVLLGLSQEDLDALCALFSRPGTSSPVTCSYIMLPVSLMYFF